MVAGALVLAVLIGGLTRMRSQSAGYERAVDRSYAAQARLFVGASDRLATRFHALVGDMRRDHRTTLEFALDTLVRSSASVAAEAATAASPAPSGDAAARVATAMADRAKAMSTLRSAVDGLLGMTPLPVTGSPDPSAAVTPRPLSPAGAATELTKVGALLVASDRSYASGRRALRAAPGRARLPSSVWSGRRGAWRGRATIDVADAIASAPSLTAVRRVELVTHALALTPAPVPSVAKPHGGTSGVALLPPTGHLDISVVVANDGDVGERGVAVHASVAEVPSVPSKGTVAAEGTTRHLSLGAHSSASMTLPGLSVVPGNRYTVAVSVDPPLPNAPGTVTTETLSVRIAPPGPPSVAQLSPTEGRDAGGGDVTILGSGFTWVQSVTFGTDPARFKVVSSTQITAIAPPGTGSVDVRVANPGGASETSKADRYRYRHK